MVTRERGKVVIVVVAVITLGLIGGGIVWGYGEFQRQGLGQRVARERISSQLSESEKKLNMLEEEYRQLKNSDQVLINKELEKEIGQIKENYLELVKTYEDILDLRDKTKTLKLEERLAEILAVLGKNNYASASAMLAALNNEIKKTETAMLRPTIASNIPVKDNPPGAGYAKQVVKTDVGDFVVDVIAADLKSTKVVIETASEQNCSNDCPVASLGTYVAKAGSFAGINGPYFCPAAYPSCAGKTNSFDTLLMNKNKYYFNSDNNVYSSNPVMVFSTVARTMATGAEWGRDAGVDAVIMGRPLLVQNGEVKFGGNSDNKESSRGNRSFIGANGETVYIGVVRGATVAEVAKVLAKMGVRDAINLDSGGSTALWAGGKYVAGPGRDTPFGILLVKR